MTNELLPGPACTSMDDVRRGIDALDRRIVALLGDRFRYIEAAARIKPNPEDVRDEARIAEVVDNVGRAAAEEGVPVDLVEDLYRMLVEYSVRYETEEFARKTA